ncbi:dynein regulatory complex protein 10 isoform X1 [Pezoporus wallicus]|uniref:dynein regulatory complex protein 10 isoform X1 n=1 Tax=Pezoporus wallicus TaxID=35540 RepID=UPI00254A87D2|nr:dynein regulatory complex protein 10 isoform X1 [Pezoporus wallicus]XP_061321714.1 dynein regulatory complex protein 10 isoform X1 [Pezoporus flaviventris]
MATGDPDVFPSQDVKQSTKPLVKGMASPRKAKITFNAMKMLDPRHLKPDSMETDRIMNVLDETAAKLEMSSLIPRVIDSLDRFADVLGPEITKNLLELQELSMEMECLLASSGEETTKAEEQRGRLCFLEQSLKCSIRNVLRLFLANPSLLQALKPKAGVADSPAEVFVRAFGVFRNFMLERLLTSPVEEEGKIQFVADISLQIKKHTEAITALQAKLAAAIQTREDEISKKDNMIKDLKTRIQDLAKDSKISMQRIKEEGENQQKVELQASQSRCAGLQQDIEQLQRQLTTLVVEHRASELMLRKRKCRLEMEIWNWVQKYDTDMAEKQAEYEEVDAAYAEEKAQLSLLTEKHALLLQEYTQIEEERKMLREKEEEALKELNTKNRAAARIQALWKGYLVRRLYRPKKKKGKGKKGKKGKK